MRIEELRDLLHREGCSCVVYNGEVTMFHRKGVIDLFELFNNNPNALRGAMVADKVIGRAAAAILIEGGVKELYTDVISSAAMELLDGSGIEIGYGLEVEYIRNRANDGMCPLESACQSIESAGEVIELLRGWKFPDWMRKKD